MSKWANRRHGVACGTKRSFASEGEALDRLKRYARQGGMSAQRAYECPWCGRWHLTSQPAASA